MPSTGEKVRILVDHREVGSGVPEHLAELEGVTLEIQQLDIADYVLSSRVTVERKSTSDFGASILDKRLFAQAEQLKRVYDLVIYLVEGSSLYDVEQIHPNALRGAISFLIILGGVSVLRSESPEDSALLLATMARHEQQGLGYDLSYHHKRRSPSPQLQMRYLVEDFPGIGPRTAQALLERFGSLRALFAAGEDALRQVSGIGPKRAARIVALLTREYAAAQASLPGSPQKQAM